MLLQNVGKWPIWQYDLFTSLKFHKENRRGWGMPRMKNFIKVQENFILNGVPRNLRAWVRWWKVKQYFKKVRHEGEELRSHADEL